MPDGKSDITHYSNIFSKSSPPIRVQAVVILLIGLLAGAAADMAVHYSLLGPLTIGRFAFAGASAGVLLISVPALLTAFLIKAMRRRLKLKYVMLLASFIAAVYAVFVIADTVIFALLRNYTLAYVVLVLANAGVYCYWFFVEKFVMARRKMAVFTATIHPLINIFFFIPLGSYVLDVTVPPQMLLLKLYAGMTVFMLVGYLSLFVIDRPMKKEMNISSAMLFTVMLNQIVYDFNFLDLNFLGSDAGMKRDVGVDVLALRGKSRLKAVFVRPDIHYGPFANVGGSIATEHLGKMLADRYRAAPFILHGAVNLNDNPISTSQVYRLGWQIDNHLRNMKSFRRGTGSIGIGSDGVCSAINVRIGDVSLLTLTKAPMVTEDMERPVGQYLEDIAKEGGYKVILVDAHNSRSESASAEELEGIKVGSKYIVAYEKAIKRSMAARKSTRFRVGVAHQKIRPLLGNPRDLGDGYTSACIFESAGRKFGIVYFDANNIRPEFREALLKHVKSIFNIDLEVCTTDTHSVNSIALNASNTLGRFTRVEEMYNIIDSMVALAINDLEPVRYNFERLTVKNFKVWGQNSEETLTKVGRQVVTRTKYAVPFIIAAGFIVAAWIIYIV